MSYWTDERIEVLLRCKTRSQLLEAFPDKNIPNLVNRRAIFRQQRPDLAPDALPDAAPPTPQSTTPRGWEAGVELKGDTGTLCSGTVDAPVTDWNELLRLWDLDPTVFEVVEPVTFKAWDMGIKNPAGEIETKRLYSYRAAIRRIAPGVSTDELERLREQVALLPSPARRTSPLGDGTFVVCLADWQVGKGEAGGTDGIVARLERALGSVWDRYEQVAERVDEVALVGLGDLFENCSGYYAAQEFMTDRTRREQTNIVRRMILRYLRAMADTGLPITVAAVGGNHGENRKGGKMYTTFGDNDDVAVFEQVQDIVRESPEVFGNPEFHLAGDDLTLLLELSGVKVGLAHGHQFGTKNQATAWWQKQALGDQPVGRARVLLNGHFHSLDVTTWGTRTRIQAPSMDGASQWYREKQGVETVPGLLTLVVDPFSPLGFSGLQVL